MNNWKHRCKSCKEGDLPRDQQDCCESKEDEIELPREIRPTSRKTKLKWWEGTTLFSNTLRVADLKSSRTNFKRETREETRKLSEAIQQMQEEKRREQAVLLNKGICCLNYLDCTIRFVFQTKRERSCQESCEGRAKYWRLDQQRSILEVDCAFYVLDISPIFLQLH